MLAFLLDIVEVAEVTCSHLSWLHVLMFFFIYQSHFGPALAKAFQDMLSHFEITDKVLAINANNATCNDTQMNTLAEMDNSFDEDNRVRCTPGCSLLTNSMVSLPQG
jgi:hypothetical protein